MKKSILILSSSILFFLSSCGGDSSTQESEATPESSATPEEAAPIDPMQDKGVGIVTSVTLGDIDNALVEKGSAIFQAKCVACHAIDKKVVGPALKDVTKRRTPEWIMNMILDPTKMTTEDPIAKELLAQMIAQMANQSLTEDEARSVLEFFRNNDK